LGPRIRRSQTSNKYVVRLVLCPAAQRNFGAAHIVRRDDASRSEAGANAVGAILMTDYPRYEQVKGSPDSAYRGYHGARLVSLVFGLVDR